MSSKQALKVVQYRLTNTPSERLQYIIQSLHARLLECKDLIEQQSDTKSTSKPDRDIVHNLKRTLSSFLVDRKDVRRRWAALVLIKAIVGFDIRSVSDDLNQWIRGILGILSKWDDPQKTKEIGIFTIAQIALTVTTQQTKELIIPVLPGFIKACLQNITFESKTNVDSVKRKTQRKLLPTVFGIFALLIEHHATVFRPFANKLRELLLPVIAHAPSSLESNVGTSAQYGLLNETQINAQRLFIRLHFLAPKNGALQAWNDTVRSIISDLQATVDSLYRSVSTQGHSRENGVIPQHNEDLTKSGPSSSSLIGLPQWDGVFAGSERVIGLLSLLSQAIKAKNAGQVSLPVVGITSILTRIMHNVDLQTSNGKAKPDVNNSFTSGEKEALWSVLPAIHTQALSLLHGLCEISPSMIMPQAALLLDQVGRVAERNSFSEVARQQAYRSTASLLVICGRGVQKDQLRLTDGTVKMACSDAVPDHSFSKDLHIRQSAKGSQSSNASTILATSPSNDENHNQSASTLQSSARALLATYLTYIPPHEAPTWVRTLIDRTAILSHDKDIMLSSVINAPSSINKAGGKVRSSILPFVARSYGQDNDVEGFMRPRLPIVIKETTIEDEYEERVDRANNLNARSLYESGLLDLHQEAPEETSRKAFDNHEAEFPQSPSEINMQVHEDRKRQLKPATTEIEEPTQHTQSSKRQRTTSPRPSPPGTHAEERIEPSDPVNLPDTPAPVPMMTNDEDSNVVVKPADAAVANIADPDGQSGIEGPTLEGDSDEGMSLPELELATSSSEEGDESMEEG